jgi:hypothetical protein
MLPTDPAARKAVPVCSGVLDYFPAAIAAVARLSQAGNDQHNPGAPLHWDRAKSGDEADALVRHLLQRGTVDTDGVRHSAKVAWRALALLQKELEAEEGAELPRGARVEADPFALHWHFGSVIVGYVDPEIVAGPTTHTASEGIPVDRPFEESESFDQYCDRIFGSRVTAYDRHPGLHQDDGA